MDKSSCSGHAWWKQIGILLNLVNQMNQIEFIHRCSPSNRRLLQGKWTEWNTVAVCIYFATAPVAGVVAGLPYSVLEISVCWCWLGGRGNVLIDALSACLPCLLDNAMAGTSCLEFFADVMFWLMGQFISSDNQCAKNRMKNLWFVGCFQFCTFIRLVDT